MSKNANKRANYIAFRTFPYSMSAMRTANTYADDVHDMLCQEDVPQSAIPTLRKGKRPVPERWDDMSALRAVQKYTPKPKGTRHRDRASIRTADINHEGTGGEQDL